MTIFEKIKLNEEILFVLRENIKTPNGKRSTNKRILANAIREIERLYGSEIANTARDYLTSAS